MKNSNIQTATRVFIPLLFALFILLCAFKFDVAGDPIAILNHPDFSTASMEMTAADFKESKGVSLKMEENKKYEVAVFNLVWVPKAEDPVEVVNREADFNQRASGLIQAAKPGDTYYFENIRAKSESLLRFEGTIKHTTWLILFSSESA